MHLLALAVLIWELVNLQNDFIQPVTTIWLLFGESLVTWLRYKWKKIRLFDRIFCACLHVCMDAKKILGSIGLKCVAWTRQTWSVWSDSAHSGKIFCSEPFIHRSLFRNASAYSDCDSLLGVKWPSSARAAVEPQCIYGFATTGREGVDIKFNASQSRA